MSQRFKGKLFNSSSEWDIEFLYAVAKVLEANVFLTTDNKITTFMVGIKLLKITLYMWLTQQIFQGTCI